MRVIDVRDEGVVRRLVLLPGEDGRTLIDSAGLAGLKAGIEGALADTSCRILLLEGPGPGKEGLEPAGFCQGLDLAEVLELPEAAVSEAAQRFAACLARLRQAPFLVVVAADGAVAGGGLGLVAAADLALASARATFALPELHLGLLPAIVMPVLLERLAPRRACGLALAGEAVTAARALELGIVDEVAGCDEILPGAAGSSSGAPAAAGPCHEALQRRTRALLRRALRLEPAAVAAIKRLPAQLAGLDLPQALALGAERTAAMLREPERVAALRGFLEGQAPPWFARYTSPPRSGVP